MNNQEAIKVTDIQQEIFDLTKQNDEIDVQTIVQNCAKLIAPVWPLETFIACNPLHGFESMPFESMICRLSRVPQLAPVLLFFSAQRF